MLTALTPEQWAAETLCRGWDAADVAAHLIVREREPLAGPGIVLGGRFRRFTRRRCAVWKARGPQRMIQALRAGPPWPLSGPFEDAQTVEDWIHEQDIRRGGAALDTPEPDPPLAETLWAGVKRISARTLVLGGDAVIELTDGQHRHRVQARRWVPVAAATTAVPDATISGPVGELLLYVAGRAGAQVTVDGDPATRSALARQRRAV